MNNQENQTKKENKHNIKFIQIESELLINTHIIAPDGTKHNLGAFERMLYVYLRFRYDNFKDDPNGKYFESQETINSYFSFVSLKTIQRALKTLEQVGLLTITRKTGTKGRNNVYVVNPYVMTKEEETNVKMKRDTSFSKINQPKQQNTIDNDNCNNSYNKDIPF